MKTTVNITESTSLLENLLIKKMDIPKTTFHRRAIDYFIKNNVKMMPELLIIEWSDPKFVKKKVAEQVYLDENRKEQLKQIAEKNDCGFTVVICNAIMVYCSVLAPKVLDTDLFEELFRTGTD